VHLQSDLRRKLGVTAPVVTRMVRALEGRGWVVREPPAHDRRQRLVKLTPLGEKSICRARRMILRRLQQIVCEAICFGGHRSPDQRLIHMSQLESYLDVLREDFGDKATLYYPWGHPDD
jgi:DNA-binding MarR family transcriptional regulator